MAASLTQLLQLMMSQKGSDLHVAVGTVPMMRIRADLNKVEHPPLTSADVESLIAGVTTPEQRKELHENKTLDFSFKSSGIGIFRVNIFYQRNGLAFVMRALTETPPKFDDLKLPEILRRACDYPNGLVLVTGPTGSGKSTTLAAMISLINHTQKGHILTLEDPIEFQHESKMCMVNQRSLGGHFTSFASALKAALREDPDTILVGEMRDPETIELAITAAETGHLVFSTLHTNSAPKSVDRIIDVFPPEQQPQIRSVLSETLRLVVSQKLVPTADKKRRIAIHDILVVNHAVANLIREGKTFQIPTVMQTGRAEGMQSFDRVLLDLVKSGEVAGDIAYEYANEKSHFTQWAPKKEGAPAAPSASPNAAPKPQGSGGALPPTTMIKKPA